MDSRDLSILTQVAFKEASADFRNERGDITSDDGKALFEEIFSAYQESLVAAVQAAVNSAQPAKAQSSSRPTYGQFEAEYPEAAAADAIGREFGATEVPNEDQGGFEIRMRRNDGQQPDAAPAWLVADAAEAGVSEVWDNRPVSGRGPWFKEVVSRGARGHGKNGDAAAFWPPKADNRS